MKVTKLISILTLLLFSVACSEGITIPKPPTYLRLDLPNHTYQIFQDSVCSYHFELASIYSAKSVYDHDKKLTCNKDINLGPLNGMLFFSFIDMDKPLGEYVNYAINKVDEHKIKATAIEDSIIIRGKDRVFGTFFELQGDVATPFQFYLTDSTKHFVSGVVYLNKTPKYDSLKPSLEYLKKDLYHLMETFHWD